MARSTKIVALVRGLKRLQDGEKALVFSEWEDMLGLLSHALEKNGIQHLRCKGAKAISKGLAIFKKDPGCLPTKWRSCLCCQLCRAASDALPLCTMCPTNLHHPYKTYKIYL